MNTLKIVLVISGCSSDTLHQLQKGRDQLAKRVHLLEKEINQI